MHKTVFKHGFRDRRCSARNSIEQNELGLHVGGKPWKGVGTKGQRPVTPHLHMQSDSLASMLTEAPISVSLPRTASSSPA
ncbi:MAG: hypothetical protein CM1200mP20_10970 [Pseudomonadota bacterium]|nr:MAG: hypothetical protein CM1200mP20_10970 [Pseudomonadota bacterium]